MKVPHILKHRQRYWYDRAIPRHLHAHLGTSRHRVNLNTSDIKEAIAAKAKHDAIFALMIDRANRETTGALDPVKHAEALALALREASLEPDPDTGELELYVDTQEAEKIEAQVSPSLRPYFVDIVTGKVPKRMRSLIEEYLASQAHLDARTLLERRTVLEKLLRWSASNGVLNIAKFTRTHAKAFTSSLNGDPATVGKALQGPRGLWKHLEDDGVNIDPNIWKGLAPKKSRQAKNTDQERPFTLPELQSLFSGNARPDLRDAMTLSLYSGMRLSEIGDLRLEHLDLSKEVIKVPGTKTSHALRTIPLHSKLRGLLETRMNDKGPRDYILHELGSEPLKHGRKRSAMLSQAFTRYREAQGVKDERQDKRRSLVNFHSFRRTAATAMVENAVPPDVINAFFGWSGQGAMRLRYSVGADMLTAMRSALEVLKWDL